MRTEIHVLKAYHGDSILIKTFDNKNNPFNILIDGGPPSTFKFALRAELSELKVIHLLILTHIDYDHIGGIITFFNNSIFDEIVVEKYWLNCKNLIEVGVNSNDISYDHAKTLEELFLEKKISLEKVEDILTTQSDIKQFNGIKITILSPEQEIIDKLYENWKDLKSSSIDKVEDVNISKTVNAQVDKGSLPTLSNSVFSPNKKIDDDIINSSSLALLIEGLDFSFLSLADSRAELVTKRLIELNYNDNDKKLKVDFVKISHHGSKYNTSNDLLDLLESDNFIISTNGGIGRSKHPDRETIARILYHPKRNLERKRHVIFNYPLNEIERTSGKIFTDEELKEGNWYYSDNVKKIPFKDA